MKHVSAILLIITACQPEELKSPARRADPLTQDAAKNTRDQLHRGMKAVSALTKSPDKNVIYSPLSIDLVLAMLELGAAGETKSEIDAYFGDPLLHDTLNAITQALAERDRVDILSSNALFVDRRFKAEVKSDYLDALARFYGTGLKIVDFKTNGADEINAFADASTRGKIKEVVDQAQVRDLLLAISNALYFKADWKQPFATMNTQDATFVAVTGEISVPFMRQTGAFLATITDTATAVELPYKNEALVADLVIPATNDAAGIDAAIAALEQSEVDVSLPKLKLRSDKMDIRTVAQTAFGINALFNPEKADLSGIADAGLVVAFLEQSALLEVDEQGTVAVAVTTGGIGPVGVASPPKIARFDRPFYFVLRDKPTGAVLFLAHIQMPSSP